MTNNGANGHEMLTAKQVHGLTGVPVSTLHDWAAKREQGIEAATSHPAEQSSTTLAARRR
jgi:hypothetical protein